MNESYRIHQYVMVGGPYNGYRFGGCPGTQCDDENCDRLPAELTAWEGGTYKRTNEVSIGSDGPFEVWNGSYRWVPE